MIQIETVKAQISIKTTNAKVSIQSPPASFDMKTKQAEIQITSDPLKIRIDQSQCFNESGRMNNQAFSSDNASRGEQAQAEGLSRIVGEGNQLAEVGSNADMVAEIAYGNSFDIREYDYGTMPRSKPQIDFVGGKMDIKVDDGYVQTNAKPNMPRIDYEAGNVETTLSQHPNISVRYVGENIDKSV